MIGHVSASIICNAFKWLKIRTQNIDFFGAIVKKKRRDFAGCQLENIFRREGFFGTVNTLPGCIISLTLKRRSHIINFNIYIWFAREIEVRILSMLVQGLMQEIFCEGRLAKKCSSHRQ